MIYEVDFATKAKEDIAFFQKAGNQPLLKKISALIKEVAQQPFTGTGKPEALKYGLACGLAESTMSIASFMKLRTIKY